jgi:hypothetical protein
MKRLSSSFKTSEEKLISFAIVVLITGCALLAILFL